MPDNFTTGRPSLDRVIDTVVASDSYRNAAAEAAKRLRDQRATLVARLRTLEKQADADFPPVHREHDAAVAAVNTAIAARDRVGVIIARDKLAEVDRRRSQMSWAFSTEHDGLEAQLRESADPAIAEFLHDLVGLHYVAGRKLPATDEVVEQSTNPVTGKAVLKSRKRDGVLTSAAGVEIVLAARHAAEQLQLAADQAGVPAELARLRSTLPAELLRLWELLKWK